MKKDTIEAIIELPRKNVNVKIFDVSVKFHIHFFSSFNISEFTTDFLGKMSAPNVNKLLKLLGSVFFFLLLYTNFWI